MAVTIMDHSAKEFFAPLDPPGHRKKLPVDDSGCFSDDTGFFSASEELGFLSDSSVTPPASDLSPPRQNKGDYMKLVKKYLEMAPNLHKVDPYEVLDFDELVDVLSMAADMASLNVTAQLLDFTIGLWSQQVVDYSKGIKSLTEECVRRNKRGSSNKKTDASSQPKQDDSPSKSKFARARRSFIGDESQMSMQLNETLPGLVDRRKFVHSKFADIMNETLLDCEFDLQTFYEVGSTSSTFSCIPAAPDILQWMHQESLRCPPKREAILPLIQDSVNSYFPDADGFDSGNEMESESQTCSTLDILDSSNAPPELEVEVENREPPALRDPLCDIGTDDVIEGLKAIVSENQENVKALGKRESLRKRNARNPLEPLDMTKNLNANKDVDLPSEVKRLRLDDDLSDINMQNEPCGLDDSGYADADYAAVQDMPSLPPILPNEVSPLPSEAVEVTSMYLKPVFEDGEHQLLTTYYRRTENSMNIIKNLFIKMAQDELRAKKRNELPFLEVIRKSHIPVFELNPGGIIKKKSLSLTIPGAFLACLHVAEALKMFITPPDNDGLFKITTVTQR